MPTFTPPRSTSVIYICKSSFYNILYCSIIYSADFCSIFNGLARFAWHNYYRTHMHLSTSQFPFSLTRPDAESRHRCWPSFSQAVFGGEAWATISCWGPSSNRQGHKLLYLFGFIKHHQWKWPTGTLQKIKIGANNTHDMKHWSQAKEHPRNNLSANTVKHIETQCCMTLCMTITKQSAFASGQTAKNASSTTVCLWLFVSVA